MAPYWFIELIATVVLAIFLIDRIRKTFVIPSNVRLTGAACGRCGYAYRGEPRCPECGGRIDHVGIMTPRLLLATRPGASAAAACIAVLVILTGLVGQSIGRAVASSFNSTMFEWGYRMTEGSLRYGFKETGPNRRRQGMGIVPDVELTVYVQLFEPGSAKPGSPRYSGEIVLALHPSGQTAGISLAGSGRLADQVPRVPHIRIDAETRVTRVFNADGAKTAEYTTIHPAAFDDLVNVAALATGDPLVRSSIEAARKIFPEVSTILDGGWNPSWISKWHQSDDGSVMTISLGGGVGSFSAPSGLVPRRSLLITILSYLWWLGLVFAGAWLFRTILLRRSEIMAEPAAK